MCMPSPYSCSRQRTSDLWSFTTRQTPAPAARVMQRYTQLLFEHSNLDQRGQLWLGH